MVLAVIGTAKKSVPRDTRIRGSPGTVGTLEWKDMILSNTTLRPCCHGGVVRVLAVRRRGLMNPKKEVDAVHPSRSIC